MNYGVKANIKAPHRFLRMGALCWVKLLNPGNGGDRILVRGLSRGGRAVESWVDSRDLTNFRSAWISGPDQAMPFDSRAAAETWAVAMNSRFGLSPVREHAARHGRPAPSGV